MGNHGDQMVDKSYRPFLLTSKWNFLLIQSDCLQKKERILSMNYVIEENSCCRILKLQDITVIPVLFFHSVCYRYLQFDWLV